MALFQVHIPVAVVQTKAKHADLRMLRHHYAPGKVAEALGTAHASQLLSDMMLRP